MRNDEWFEWRKEFGVRVLIVEDDAGLRTGLAQNLRMEGWEVEESGVAKPALEMLEHCDVLVTDIRLPDMDGLDLVVAARKARPELEMIVMTGFASIGSAVEAMRRGARNYLAKPFDPEELILHLRDVEKTLRLREAASLAGRGSLVGASAPMQRVYAAIDAAAYSNAPVLISGETGTGKEEAARAVHDLSNTMDGSFVAVNLGALPKELVESELFGHERGAFTGAHAAKKGRFVLADKGTLFLDEIDSLPVELQPKLLRALAEGFDAYRGGLERQPRGEY